MKILSIISLFFSVIFGLICHSDIEDKESEVNKIDGNTVEVSFVLDDAIQDSLYFHLEISCKEKLLKYNDQLGVKLFLNSIIEECPSSNMVNLTAKIGDYSFSINAYSSMIIPTSQSCRWVFGVDTPPFTKMDLFTEEVKKEHDKIAQIHYLRVELLEKGEGIIIGKPIYKD